MKKLAQGKRTEILKEIESLLKANGVKDNETSRQVVGKLISVEEKLKELIEMDTDIKRAEERLEYLSSDKETIEIYKAREKSLHERANMISSAM